MSYCSKCGAELDKDAKFCPKCGTSAGHLMAKPEKRRVPREHRRPMNTLTIALIVFLVVVLAVGAILAAAFLLGVWHPFGQVVGSENLVTQEKFFSDFSVVEVGSEFEVEITQSNSYSIKITADDNILDYVEVFKTSDTLTIRLKLGYSYQSTTLSAKITMPTLYELELSGGTHGTVEGFSSSHEFVLGLSGGSSLTGDFMTSEDGQFTLSGGSTLSIDGAANDLRITGSSGSHLELSNFTVHNANVDLSGGSHATVNLDGRLDADLSGGSTLLYIGDPALGDIDTSGGSTIGRK
jgi:ribosomal protein L40E